MVWQQVNPVSRTSINWRWLVTSLICIAVATSVTMMAINSLFIWDGRSLPIEIIVEFTFLFAAPIFAIGMLVFIAQANIKTSIERAGIRLCRRCLNRAYDESQTKCEACQLELKEPGPMRSKIAK